MLEEPNYFSIIPAKVLFDENLHDFDKLLFAAVTSLSNKNGYCTATNGYFKKSFHKSSSSTITTSLARLIEAGYIRRQIIMLDNQTVGQRRLYPMMDIYGNPVQKNDTPLLKNHQGVPKKLARGISKNWQENNTSINNKNNIYKPIRPKSEKQTYGPDDPNYKLAKYLLEKIRDTSPQVYPTESKSQPKLQSWANDIRLMNERDKRSYEQIKKMIDWCQDDDFWHKNILSAASLRKKYGQMAVKMNSSAKQGSYSYYGKKDRRKEIVTDWSKHEAKPLDPEEFERIKEEYRKFKEESKTHK
ncbi:MAG: helix-turn-helix domain-containing protein [Lactobacillus sp.]|nr:helix-turn-helix domain-containing protein [Lactobacillus sp.]